MARVNKVRRKANSRLHRATPFPLSSHPRKVLKDVHLKKKHSKALAKKDWEDATCSVCMEFPHNAVLLLCSSYEKGCRPYMCATSCRYSNCLDQYKKAYTKVTSTESSPQSQGSTENLSLGSHSGLPNEKMEVSELLCPLCRGQVKGWTVVEPARKYLNAKKRTCMQDNCSYVGTYKQLRKHVRAEHPLARPREVDPSLEEKWKRLEGERERNDVLSTIRSSMPGALILGDYVIEEGGGEVSTWVADLTEHMIYWMRKTMRCVAMWLHLDVVSTGCCMGGQEGDKGTEKLMENVNICAVC